MMLGGPSFPALPYALAIFPLLPKQCLTIFLASELSADEVQRLLGLVHTVLNTSNSENVLCLCCQFFLKYEVPNDAHATLLAIVAMKSVIGPKLALDIFRCFWATDQEFAVGMLVRCLEQLPELKAYDLAILLWEHIDAAQHARLDKELRSRFPFLLIEAKPDAASAWFVKHSPGCWPVRSSPKFTEAIVRLMRKSGRRVVFTDFDSIPPSSWQFLLDNQDFIQLKGVDKYLQQAEVQNKLKRIGNVSSMLDRSFTFSLPIGALLPHATATPFLKRGIVLRSQLLVSRSLAFTRIAFTLKTINAILQTFPGLRDDVICYSHRLKIHFESIGPEPAITEASASFSMKKAFIRTMCIQFSEINPIVLEMFRMFLITGMAGLGNKDRWLYCLRFLRITLAIDGRETALRRDTASHFETIMSAFAPTSPYITREMQLLVESIYTAEELPVITAKYPQLKRTETFVNVEIPSFFLEILRKPTPTAMLEVMRQLDQSRREVLNMCFVDDAVIGMLIRDRSLITRPEDYLAIFLSNRYPQFERAAPIYPTLIARCPTAFKQLKPLVKALADRSWSLPSALPTIAFFHRTMLKGTERAELKEFEQIQDIFVSAQTVENAQHFAASLGAATAFCDVPALLQKYVLGLEYRFFVIFFVIAVYIRDPVAAKRTILMDMFTRGSASLPKKSRQLALEQLANGAIEEAFVCALAEM
jgi:hypothetical protein